MVVKLTRTNRLLLLLIWLVGLAGCNSADLTPTIISPKPTESQIVTAPTEIIAPTELPASETPAPPSENTAILQPTSLPATATLRLTPTLLPAQQLINDFTDPVAANGELLILYGQILDNAGNPVSNAGIEIWQTDASGVYDHPQDPGTNSRDTAFQFFGSTTADNDGWYAFRTIMPGRYEPRPRHIHFKVKQDGNTLLTSQFYFSEDIAVVEGEGMFQAVGDSGGLLLLQLVQGESSLMANGQIVLDVGGGGLPLTPSQAEGPYYPVVPVSQYDNDLVILP